MSRRTRHRGFRTSCRRCGSVRSRNIHRDHARRRRAQPPTRRSSKGLTFDHVPPNAQSTAGIMQSLKEANRAWLPHCTEAEKQLESMIDAGKLAHRDLPEDAANAALVDRSEMINETV